MIAAVTARREIRSRQSGWAQALARQCTAMGITANRMSVWSLAAAGVASLALVLQRLVPGAVVVLCIAAAIGIGLRLLANMLDGMIADRTGATPSGALFNEIPDRISDSMILVCAGFAANATTLGVFAALMAVATAYIRLTATLVGVDAPFVGPMAKPRRMLLLAAALIASAIAPPLHGGILSGVLVVIGLGSLVTAARRARVIAAEMR